ncbi:MAG: peptidase M16, partial [Desulfobacteraceae bacterium]|nr:peptidase M16 [Desulfobacteraceae bacterium]
SFEVLVLSLLSEIFLGNPASPLRKALIDSGFGTALSDGTGFDSDNRDTLFACGLKDVEESAAPEIEKIIFGVLENLATNGIDKKLTESAIHQIEFHRKEITNTPYPYGIKLLLGISGGWFHGGDPVRILEFDEDLKKLNDELSKGPFFENCIKKYFLDNPHRVVFRLVPDQSKEQKENERVAAELEQIKSQMTSSELDKIKEDAEALKKLQEAEEDLSGLPTLGLEDIPPSVQSVQEDTSHFSLPTSHFSLYSQPTSGIFYFSGVFGTGILEKQFVPLAPFFCYAFSKVGTAKRDYAEMAQMIDLYTGGIGMSSNVRTSYSNTGECLPFITFNGKSLVRNQGRLFEIIEELLYEVNFSDIARLKKLLLEYRAGLESQVIHGGHRLAMSLSSRNFSATRALNEAWNGVHHLQTIKKLTDDLTDDKLKSLSDDLVSIGRTVLTENNLKIAMIGEQETLPAAIEESGKILAKGSGSGKNGFIPPEIDFGKEVPREGWSTSSAVSFVASSFETVRMDHEDSAALSVISRILRSMYLHREIREKGGAYGGFATYSTEDGVFSFGSYRDPHIVSTLKVYDNASVFIRSGNYNDEDIKEAILQVCSEIDRPDPPGPSAKKAFYRKIISLSDEARKSFKERLLEVNRKQVISTAEKYFDPDRPGNAVAVISGEEKLKEANEKMKDNPLVLHRI